MEMLYTVGGITLCCLGSAGIVESFFDLRRWRAAPEWPVTEGLVVSSRIKEHGAWHDDYTERLKLKYTFRVHGREYTGRRVRAGQELDLTIGSGPGSAWSSARPDARNYPIGSVVYVRYDPRNPKSCCLQPGGLAGILAKILVCAALIWGGVSLMSKSLG